MLLRRGLEKATLGREAPTRALEDLAARGRVAADVLRDLPVVQLEHVVQQEDRALRGVSRWSTTRNAIETCSRRSARAMPACSRSTGSGSRSGRLSSRRARAEPSSFRHSRVTMVTRNARGDSGSTSWPCQRSQASCTMSSARAESPSMR